MQGRYSIPLRRDGNGAGFHALIQICRSLERNGLNYEPTLERSSDGAPCLTIRAWGTPRLKRQRRNPVWVPPEPTPPPTLEQCRKRLAEAVRDRDSLLAGIRRNLRSQWLRDSGGFNHWSYKESRHPRTRRLAVGRAVARIVARHKTKEPWQHTKQDYADMDAAVGCMVLRESQLQRRGKAQGWLGAMIAQYGGCWAWQGKREPQEPEQREPVFAAYLAAKEDAAYWADMVRLHEGA